VKAAVLGVALVAVAPAAASAAPPHVEQLVAYRNGEAKQQLVTAAGTSVRVGKKRCAVGSATPLAALLRTPGLGGLRLKDYGSCSRKPADAGGLYVRRIRKDSAKGPNGWVYKVGNKVGTTGAGDLSGPFGGGRIKDGARITWLYCRMKANGCQRTLAVKPEALGEGRVRVTVRAYNDFGKGRAAAGATVFLGSTSAKADSHGVATFDAMPGKARVHAEAKGMVRSFEERIEVT
jgi:hypothetical protein